MSPEEFVAWLASAAESICRKYDLPVSVCIAQGALESGWGKYIIGQFNIFGRKWNGVGNYIEVETEECFDGQWQTIVAKFQDYSNLNEAIEDWCILITEEPAYMTCLEYRTEVEAFVCMLGPIYATDPEYAGKVLATIAANNLEDYV